MQARELSWRQIVDNIPGFVYALSPTGEAEFINRQTLEFFGRTNEELKDWSRLGIVHPDDLPRAIEALGKAIQTGQSYEIEHRCRRADGVYRWFQVRGCPARDLEGSVTAWYFLITDIDDLKRAEEKLRKSEANLLTITDAIANPIAVLTPDGKMLYANRVTLQHSGLSLSEAQDDFYARTCHPDDIKGTLNKRAAGFAQGVPFELEMRLLKLGDYRWQLAQYNPLKDESGEIIRWYVTRTDIDDRKKAEERLRDENRVLREEIDRSSMFEEIVGTSKPLRNVVARISKVAPTDSSVLITGETGTGKELVARAIHRRSHRAARPFISVNCAATPRDLIASELFGHEKGAFTGATQRRLGRFELAAQGTIFLDEIGEIPPETQVALLRVLQEREFERVGGAGVIRTDVRVIAATNRNLESEIAAGRFRSDLFYRLNVFPIEMPPLRERKEDIPLLVEYFIDRYARKAGKSFESLSNRSLELLQSYPWPGNIRELQNVIERSVIVSETEKFSVDESWLARQPHMAESGSSRELSTKLAAQEKEMIEAALRESGGRVSGPTGAAQRLGMPGSTLESKIKTLKINKNRFKG